MARRFILHPFAFILFLFALALRLYRLEAQSLWLDELNTWWLVHTQSWGALWAEMWRGESAYPLYHLLLKAWIALAGDGEWALRFPSALAGALAVPVVALAASELSSKQKAAPPSSFILHPSSFILLVSPFAIWYAQDVKTYSLLLLTSALTVWLLLRALRRDDRASWLAFLAVALASLFVHRFAALLLVGCAAGWLWARAARLPRAASAVGAALIVTSALALGWQMVGGMGSEGATTGAHIPATPAQAALITLWRFVLDRGPNEAPWPLLLPALALALWGAALLLRDAWRGSTPARALVCCGALPAALFLAQLAWTRLYEPRYLMIVFPCWVLLLSYPFARREARGAALSFILHPSSFILLAGVLAASAFALFQPDKGLWSGAPVKEQYREAVRYLVRRANPRAAVVLHPEYLRTAWSYYAPRFSRDPLPAPIAFDAFKQGQKEYSQKDWDASRARALRGYDRGYLLIAPPHAKTVDPPQPDDEYGLVGLFYQYPQNAWSCGGERFSGVHVLCVAFPETFGAEARPEPQVPLAAIFGGTILFQGYTIAPFGGKLRPGGVLPITLFWDVKQQPAEDYSVFLHLCQDCALPPVASNDGPPLGGGLPTSVWKPRKPVHDERAIVLPSNLPPGRYTLLLGLYRPGDATLSARLPVSGARTLEGNRVVLGEIVISGP